MQGRDIAIIVGVIVLIILLVGLVGGGAMGFGGMMGYGGPGYGFGYGFGWWGIVMGILMIVFWALVIGGIVWLVVWLIQQARPATAGPGPRGISALDILRERYAKGEITREQFEQMKRDLEG